MPAYAKWRSNIEATLLPKLRTWSLVKFFGISTRGKAKLLGISKRGNLYLRKVLIHGARAAVLRIKRDRAPIGPWLDRLDARAPKNVVVVAMANKLARIAWAVLSSGEDYRPLPSVSAA
jgi:transposase